MARADSDSTRVAVPYVPFSTFLTALDYLKSHGTPGKIDSSVFPTFSGGMVSHLLITLRFLRVIDHQGTPQAVLTQLIDDKIRREALARILPHAYAALFQRVDLAKASPSQLDEALREQNVHGATHRKAKAFLIKSAQYAGLAISKHLTKRTRSTGPRSNGTSGKARQIPDHKTKFLAVAELPSEVRYSKTVKLPQAGGTLTLSGDFHPLALLGQEREFVYRLVDLIAEFEGKKETASK